jgi:hypothetical protein
MEFFAERRNYEQEIIIAMFKVTANGERVYAKPVNIELAPKEYGETLDPFLRFDFRDAQSLLNALHAAGMRPTKPDTHETIVESIKYHLEDMRSLVFKDKKNGK